MKDNRFKNISIRGRVAYCIMCLENYLIKCYPDKDFSDVIKKAWHIVDSDGYIDVKAYEFMEIIPEYLFEFDDFEAAEFDYLTHEEYERYCCLLNEKDETLNNLMHFVYDAAIEHAYAAIEDFGRESIDIVENAIDCLKESDCEIPNVDQLINYTFEKFDGWGDFIDSKELSSYLRSEPDNRF